MIVVAELEAAATNTEQLKKKIAAGAITIKRDDDNRTFKRAKGEILGDEGVVYSFDYWLCL